MSVVGATVVLAALVVLLLRVRAVRFGAAVVCTLFGLVLAATPAGPGVQHAVDASGSWLWVQVSTL